MKVAKPYYDPTMTKRILTSDARSHFNTTKGSLAIVSKRIPPKKHFGVQQSFRKGRTTRGMTDGEFVMTSVIEKVSISFLDISICEIYYKKL